MTRATKATSFARVEFTEPRSGGYGLHGQMPKGSKRYEFNCVVSTRLRLTDLVIGPLGGDGGRGGSSTGAPAEAQVACAVEADKYWGLTDGTAVSLASTATSSGMYEVKVAGGKRRGVCTVTEDGDVKGIMNQ